MLLNLHIKNILLIDDIDIDFEPGLNILTGETGAGKSIIIGALGIGMGGKFSKDILRNTEADGIVELTFSVENENIRNMLSELDIDISEDEIFISRRLNNGRTINRINDVTVTTAKLKAVSEILINLHAQHEQQTLLKASKHIEILDLFGKEKIAEVKTEVSEIFKEYSDIKRKLNEMDMNPAERSKRLDYIKYEISEIEAADLKKDEDVNLESEYRKIENSREIISSASEIYELTGYDNKDSAAVKIANAMARLKRIQTLDSGISPVMDIMSDIDALLNDFNREIKEYMQDMEFDDNYFNEVYERLNLINRLKEKYGNSIDEINSYLEELKTEYNNLIEYEDNLSDLKIRYEKTFEKLKTACNNLSRIRKTCARELCEKIRNALSELNFNQVKFDMEFMETKEYSANGHDAAYFVISTNVGEPVKPLYEAASGGELSRIMLAVKSCLADEDSTPTLIFDEVDVGISGITAQKVALKLSEIASCHQVISITHLPQIAAMADTNYLIEKKVLNEKTLTDIVRLDRDASIKEIARLIGGENITDKVILSAEEMKDLADSTKIY